MTYHNTNTIHLRCANMICVNIYVLFCFNFVLLLFFCGFSQIQLKKNYFINVHTKGLIKLYKLYIEQKNILNIVNIYLK